MTSRHEWFRQRPIIGGLLAGAIVGGFNIVSRLVFPSGGAWSSSWPEIAATTVLTTIAFAAWLRYSRP